MNKIQIKTMIDEVIKNDSSFSTVVELINKFKRENIDRKNILKIMEEMRVNVPEKYEDRLLEVMDVVAGFCTVKTDYEAKDQ